jgi:hypothetical protein
MKCKTCGKNSDGEYCFAHKPRKPLAQTKMLKTINKLVKNVDNNRQISDMQEFFLHIWNTRPHKSEVSGESLGKEPLSVFFHHILSKEKYPQARLDEENIILLTLDEHSSVENDMYKYEEINNRRKYLKLKYERI